MKICITFDLDDTLWAVNPLMQQANQTMFDWLAQHAPKFRQNYKLTDLPLLRAQALELQPEIGYSVTKIRQQQIKLGLLNSGYSHKQVQPLVTAAFEIFLQARQQVKFFPDAKKTLSQLKQQGYYLGALSNGNADIKRVGLAQLMQFQIQADQVGQMKPHPAMFKQVLKQTGLKPEQIIHIGDHPEHDIDGAHKAGFRSIQVKILPQKTNPLADKIVNRLIDIPAKVQEIVTSS